MPSAITAVILAAGESTRMGGEEPKVLLNLAGSPVVTWSARTMGSIEAIDSVIVVAHPESITRVAAAMEAVEKVEAVVPGGATRLASTRAGLDAVPDRDGIVLVHDAARPVVSAETIRRLLEEMKDAEAATVAVPARDTILGVDAGVVTAIPDRAGLWHAQTPQAFRLPLLRAAHASVEREGRSFTDDCGVVLAHRPDLSIRVVEGSASNIKITTPEDLAAAAAYLEAGGLR